MAPLPMAPLPMAASSVGRACARELALRRRRLAGNGSPAALRVWSRCVWDGEEVFAPAAGDISSFVYDHLLGAESYEASYGINFLAPSFRFVRFTI